MREANPFQDRHVASGAHSQCAGTELINHDEEACEACRLASPNGDSAGHYDLIDYLTRRLALPPEAVMDQLANCMLDRYPR